MTRLFKRKNNKTTIAELEEYYANQNQNRTRPLRAWLLAFVTLIVTVVLIVALFLAGRWLYSTLFNKDSETPTTSDVYNPDGTALPSYDGDIGEQNGTTRVDSDVDSRTDSATEGIVSDEAVSTTESNAGRVTTTGPGEEIPATGAGHVLIVAPASVAILGYAVSRRRQIKNS
jgi:hypothetical protein